MIFWSQIFKAKYAMIHCNNYILKFIKVKEKIINSFARQHLKNLSSFSSNWDTSKIVVGGERKLFECLLKTVFIFIGIGIGAKFKKQCSRIKKMMQQKPKSTFSGKQISNLQYIFLCWKNNSYLKAHDKQLVQHNTIIGTDSLQEIKSNFVPCTL